MDENSLRLVEANAAQTDVPFDFMRDVTPEGNARLIWKAAGLTPALTSRWFYLYVDSADTAKKARPREFVLRAKNVPNINLLNNSGFEEVKADTDLPAGWTTFTRKELTEGHAIEVATEDKKSGQRSLKMVQNGTMDQSKKVTVAIYPPFRVLPGRRYRLSGWVKRAEGDSHNEIMLWWLGSKKQNLGNKKFDAWTKRRHDWKLAQATATAPQNAHYAKIHVSIWPPSAMGVAYFDDIELVLMPKDGHPLPQVTIGKPETRK